MTKTFVCVLLSASLVVTTALPLRAAPVVADVQVTSTGPNTWTIRIRSSDAQAFDVLPLPEPSEFVVRLHGAVLAETRAPIDPVPFGTIGVTSGEDGVDVRIVLASGYRVEATQGSSPNVVEMRVICE